MGIRKEDEDQEEVTASNNASNKKGPVALKKLTPATKQQIKTRLQRCFQRAFETKNVERLSDSNQLLREIYAYAAKFVDGSKHFLACLRFLIDLTCAKTTEKPSRENCLKMVANVSLTLARRQCPEMLDLLIDFCKKAHNVNQAAYRIYACRLIGLMLTLSKAVDEIFVDGENCCESGTSLPESRKSFLYSLLLNRELDSSTAVRVEVLKAFGTAQGFSFPLGSSDPVTRTPYEVLVCHFRDACWECRLVAVQTISLDKDEYIRLMIEVAIGDSDSRVRKAALLRLAKDVKVRSITLKQRMSLIKALVMSKGGSAQLAVLKGILSEWLRSTSEGDPLQTEDGLWKAAPSKLLALFDMFGEEAITHDAIVVSLLCCKQKMGLENSEVRTFIKELIYSEVDAAVNSHNYKNLLNKTLPSLQLAHAAFLWRCTADFCKLICRTMGDWSDCQYKLLPTMHTFCDFIRRFFMAETLTVMDDETVYHRNFALMQFLKIIRIFDADDRDRREALELLRFILLSAEKELSFDTVNCVVRLMYEHFWRRHEQNEEALSEICDITSTIVHHDVNPHTTISALHETIALGCPNATVLPESLHVGGEALLRCIMIINAVMKTGRYRVMNSLLRGLLDDVVERGLVSEDSECRILSFETMGIMALGDKTCACEKMVLIKDALELDESLQVAALHILCNFSLIYGYKKVSKWYSGVVDFGDPNNDLIMVFCVLVDHKDPLVKFAACESLCKLMLSEDIDKSKEVLCRLLLKTFDSETDNLPQLKSCLQCFLEAYTRSDRNHQLGLVEAFKDIFDAITESSSDQPSSEADESLANDLRDEQSLPRVNPAEIGVYLAWATSLQSRNATDKENESLHPVLCEIILSMLTSDIDYDLDALCKVLNELDVQTWNDGKFLLGLEEKLVDICQDFCDDNQAVARSLEDFRKKVHNRVTKLGKSIARGQCDESARNDEESDEGTSELITRTAKLALRTPLTRSVTRKMRTADETPLRRRSQSSDVNNIGDDTVEFIAKLRASNVVMRRCNRRILGTASENLEKEEKLQLNEIEEEENPVTQLCGIVPGNKTADGNAVGAEEEGKDISELERRTNTLRISGEDLKDEKLQDDLSRLKSPLKVVNDV